MPAGAVSKMMANEQFRVMDNNDNIVSYWTANVSMVVMDCSQCDSLLPLPIKAPPPMDLHYKVHFLHEHELDYRTNMSKQDRVMRVRHLALVDGGANGSIIGRYMRIIYLNADRKRVCIGIAGDHHLIGNRLCCGCSVAKSNVGWFKLLLQQGAQMKIQENSILSVIQMRDHKCVVNNIAKAHGGKQEILTSTSV